MEFELQKFPGDLSFPVPFGVGSEFLAHEEEFLAGVAIHVAEEGADVGEALPFIAGHFTEEG